MPTAATIVVPGRPLRCLPSSLSSLCPTPPLTYCFTPVPSACADPRSPLVDQLYFVSERAHTANFDQQCRRSAALFTRSERPAPVQRAPKDTYAAARAAGATAAGAAAGSWPPVRVKIS